MYVITNRRMEKDEGGLEIFGSIPNEKGGNELRIVKITKQAESYKAKAIKDQLSKQRVKALKDQFKLNIDTEQPWYASLEVACELFERARKEKKHILIFVHGYNNDMADIIKSAYDLEECYPDLIVVPFSWPAKGGGACSGAANYLNDKQDARTSSDALARAVEIIRDRHKLLVESQSQELWEKAKSKFVDNPERIRQEYVRLQSAICKVSINLLCHSMGNYVMKYATIPSGSYTRKPVFDNICLVAADVNNHDHEPWVSGLDTRNGVYVVINEDDYALKWSRRKPGEEQKPRLGHYLKSLSAPNATYIDVTHAPYVGNDHGYFKGRPVEKQSRLHQMFENMFTGKRVETTTPTLRYRADINAWQIK